MSNSFKLRAFSHSDIPALVKHANNPKVTQYLRESFPSPYTEEHANGWIEVSQTRDRGCHLAVDYGGHCIGSIGVNYLTDEHRYTAE